MPTTRKHDPDLTVYSAPLLRKIRSVTSGPKKVLGCLKYATRHLTQEELEELKSIHRIASDYSSFRYHGHRVILDALGKPRIFCS
jgi:hypothetical protein